MVSSPTFVIGVDVGGTKIEAVLLSLNSESQFKVIECKRISTLRERGYSSVLTRMIELLKILIRKLPQKIRSLSGIGIGLPGTVDPESGIMLNGNTSLFVGQPLKYHLQEALGNKSLPIVLENDANCFTLAEAKAGAGFLYKKETGIAIENQIAIGIILGTGVGGGLVNHGRIFRGRKGGGLEIGHGPLGSRDQGKTCFCGLKGCAETYLSGTALIQDFKKLYPNASSIDIDGQSIFEKAQNKKSLSHQIVSRYKKNLTLFLLNLTNIFDPDYFVLGGGVSNQLSLYENLEEELRRKSFVPESSPKVYQHQLGDSAGVFGAAFLVRGSFGLNKTQVQPPL